MSSNTGLCSILEDARRDLLDLTARNRLLNTPRRSSRSGRLEIVDELSQEVFRHLVLEKKSMSFLPAKTPEEIDLEDRPEEEGPLSQPEEEELGESGLPARYTDDRLQTSLTSEGLQKRLLKLFYDARTFAEEQGVNILYLALGFLKWYEADKSDRQRHAPLLLIPVDLDRRSANARFRLRYSDDELATNLSLQERLKIDFGIGLPDVPDAEDLSPDDYFEAVREAISDQPEWEVLPNDMVLWFFSFSKFLMYRDLDPETWPEDGRLEQHALIAPLLSDGFRDEPPLCGESENLDDLLNPIDLVHVLDADSSQTLAIEEVKRGRNLVIQGPPGTGKSQTITNLIAAAVKEGKTVLFVAEKMAALEVVKRRLDNIGLGDMCLELHSNKANKRVVLQDLASTLGLGRPAGEDVARHAEELRLCRDKVNQHCRTIHAPLSPCCVTPYQVLGQLVRLRSSGIGPPECKLDDPLSWTGPEFREKIEGLGELVTQIETIGSPRSHPWFGVELDVALPTDVQRLTGLIPGLVGRLDDLTQATKRLADALRFPLGPTANDAATLVRLAERLLAAPPMDKQSLGEAVWEQRREQIDSLVRTGQTLLECRSKLDGVVAEVAWDTDPAATRQALAAHGRSWFRIFRSAYRDAQAALRGVLVDKPPKTLATRLDILDTLIRGRNARTHLRGDEARELGKQAFGGRWGGVDSDWSSLSDICEWEREIQSADVRWDFRRIMTELDDVGTLTRLLEPIDADLEPVLREVGSLFESVKLNVEAAFRVSGVRSASLEVLKTRLQAWSADPESITMWIAYYVRRCKIAAEGMSELVARVEDGTIEVEAAVGSCQMAYYEEVVREVFKRNPELAQFNGLSHERLLEKFRQLDLARIQLARYEVAASHYQSLPLGGSDVGEVGLVRRETQKKRRHLPLRQLLAQAGRAVQAIKPVFMMSPISVAQYLSPGIIDFDLLLIDEASQVRPVDALGAIARAKRMVIVGDEHQLPPTRFFSRVAGDDDADDADADDFRAGDVESILGLCCAQNLPQRMLRWHYRSRHHSLIAVSNHEFYDDKLYVIPSPSDRSFGQGVFFHHVPDGVFDRGGSATNRVEAGEVAAAVMQHARDLPKKTLGVGAFSVAQRDAIIEELELCRRNNPSLEEFFDTSLPEPFFVKNLENIQGDERDAIFISVGYAKDKSGQMTMNFGPLSNDGGQRRLNVLITRSRERCDVFSSIVSADIDLNRTRARGTRALKTFLHYAQSGELEMGVASSPDPDSEFENEVAKAIQTRGYQVALQVGVAGFYVDLAVVDPDVPGRYLIGIECDGANYRSSRSARDRDRLRRAVLRDRGWIIHRVWSADWFYRPDDELGKALAAIEDAKCEWRARDDGSGQQAPEADLHDSRESIDRAEGPDDSSDCEAAIVTEPYVEAAFEVDTSKEIHEVSTSKLVGVLARIVKSEGPIHQDEILRRAMQLWGLRRSGSRISEAVEKALSHACRRDVIDQDGLFFSPPKQEKVPIRNRADASSNTRRTEMLSPAEIRVALMTIVRVNLGVTRDEAIVETARLLGFRSTSAQLREAVSSQLDYLIEERSLDVRNGKLYGQ